MTDNFYGAKRASVLENKTFEEDILATRVMDVPSILQLRIAYNAGGQEEYIGYGARGLSESATGWLLHKLTYNGDGQVTSRQIAYDSWDNRGTADYA